MLFFLLALQAAQPTTASAKPPKSPMSPPSAYDVLRAEYARGEDTRVLDAAAASRDTTVQRLAARAFGRLERKAPASHLTPLLSSPTASVRREAINALGQMTAPMPYAAMLATERDGAVRGAIFETLGRLVPAARGAVNAPTSSPTESPLGPSDDVITALIKGLSESDATARAGAARGLEAAIRRAGRGTKINDAAIQSIREAFRANGSDEVRQLLLRALSAAGDRDAATLTLARRDTSVQVRALATTYARDWVDDPSPMVMVQALQVAGSCDHATARLRDTSDHVVLTAIDILGEKKCSAMLLDSLATKGRDWRVQSHALVSLAHLDPSRATPALRSLMRSTVWQARAWAATAAKALNDSTALATLARDPNPNVAAAALSTIGDAERALQSTHAGLAFAGASFLKGRAELPVLMPKVIASLQRLTALKRATVRDPRIALLQRIREGGDVTVAATLDPLRRDLDPDVAALAARIISEKTHTSVAAVTTRYTPAPFPSATTIASLMRGVKGRMVIEGLGTIEFTLMPEDAAVTVATFVALAERGAYSGLTWHRNVPNFVIQGGSPGADEYDGLTSTFMRDELGFARNARGTLGISTRGRDTGDGQIYFNLIDNVRLDHDYTVFARITNGLAIMDRVQEGAVIESVTILRSPR